MFVILATETFALFQPGEPYFLQFTPLLQEIDQALHLTINEGVSSVDEFNMVLKKHVQGLHKKQESGMEIVNREEDHFILLKSSFDTLPVEVSEVEGDEVGEEVNAENENEATENENENITDNDNGTMSDVGRRCRTEHKEQKNECDIWDSSCGLCNTTILL